MQLPRVERPRLRGVFHLWAFVAALAAGLVLGVLAEGGLETLSAWVYVAALAAMFGASAVYHRFPWRSHVTRLWARRVDHSMIFVFIAGSYTPFALLAFEGPTQWIVLAFAWGGALLGLALNLAWIDGPRWLSVAAYIAVGWVGVIAVPQLFSRVGVAAGVLVIVGGALYTLGAVAYATKRPNPIPRWVGFHEVFHLLVVAAAAVQFVAVSLVVL
jgi:hemolysin III